MKVIYILPYNNFGLFFKGSEDIATESASIRMWSFIFQVLQIPVPRFPVQYFSVPANGIYEYNDHRTYRYLQCTLLSTNTAVRTELFRSLDSESAATLVHAFVSSRVDYCNAVYTLGRRKITDRLQRVLNAAARVVSDTRKFDHGLSRLMHTEMA